MFKRLLTPLTAILVLLAIVNEGCRKKDDNTTTTIVNRLDKTITFDLYESASDYHNNENLLQRIVIPAGENERIPGYTFVDGRTYFMDWYTEDYYHNNWYNDNYPITGNRVRFKPEPGKNTYYIEPGYKGKGRNAFLKGGGKQTGWIAIGAYLFSNSTGYVSQWNEITTNERYRQVIIKKDFTAAYTHKDASGKILTENFEFMVQQTEVPYIEFKTLTGIAAGNMTGGHLPTAQAPDYKSNATDTVMALFPDNEYIFMMVRQQ